MGRKSDKSIQYYEEHADEYAAIANSVSLDNNIYRAFTDLIPACGRVLDLGCGSGRDTKYFAGHGFSVTPMDGSMEMCRKTEEYTGIPAIHKTFDELSAADTYDGVWANASLLHVPAAQLPGVLHRIAVSLRRDGIMMASFKAGTGEREDGVRHYTDFTEVGIRKSGLFNADFTIIEIIRTDDSVPGRGGFAWTNVIARKNRN